MANQLVHCTEGAGRLCKVNGLIQFVFQKENSVSHEEDSLQGDEARDRVSPQSSVELSVACFKNIFSIQTCLNAGGKNVCFQLELL